MLGRGERSDVRNGRRGRGRRGRLNGNEVGDGEGGDGQQRVARERGGGGGVVDRVMVALAVLVMLVVLGGRLVLFVVGDAQVEPERGTAERVEDDDRAGQEGDYRDGSGGCQHSGFLTMRLQGRSF